MTPPRLFVRSLCRTLGAAALLSTALATFGCASSEKRANMDTARASASALSGAAAPGPYTLQPGDEISVVFFYNHELDTSTKLRPDGRFSLPFIEEVDARGRSLPDLTAELENRYEPFLKHPEITLNVASYASQVIFVGGEVRQPGVIPLIPGMTVLQGVFAAGGWQPTGDAKKIVVVRNQGTSEPLLLLVDLHQGLDELAGSLDFPLQPKDMVFVPMTGIAKANQFIRQYIRDMLPIQSSFNLQYLYSNTPFTNPATP